MNAQRKEDDRKAKRNNSKPQNFGSLRLWNR